MAQCVDCIRLKKELADKEHELRILEVTVQRIGTKIKEVNGELLAASVEIVRRDTEKELFERQKGACGGS